MRFPTSCPACQKKLMGTDETMGKKVRCPSCDTVFALPFLAQPILAVANSNATRQPTPPPLATRTGPGLSNLQMKCGMFLIAFGTVVIIASIFFIRIGRTMLEDGRRDHVHASFALWGEPESIPLVKAAEGKMERGSMLFFGGIIIAAIVGPVCVLAGFVLFFVDLARLNSQLAGLQVFVEPVHVHRP